MTSQPYVQTVLGRVDPAVIGHTLPHEHILVDLSNGKNNVHEMIGNTESSVTVLTPETGSLKRFGAVDVPANYGGLWDEEIRLDNRMDAEKNFVFYGHAYRLLDVDDATDAVADFRDDGGSCMVDCTAIGMGRSPEGLRVVSRRTGVHLVMSTGFYLGAYQPDAVRELSESKIVDLLIQELSEGPYAGAPIPGMIKSAVSSSNDPQEQKTLRAGLRTSAATGVPLTVHPGEGRESVFAAARLIEELGADPQRVIIGHIDSRLHTPEDLIELARFGCYMSLDAFGRETSMRQRGNIDMPNDAMRLNSVRTLIDAGFGEQVLLSQDMALKWQLRKWGGLGYGHIAANVVPLMRNKNFDEKTIDLLVRVNPLRAITLND